MCMLNLEYDEVFVYWSWPTPLAGADCFSPTQQCLPEARHYPLGGDVVLLSVVVLDNE